MLTLIPGIVASGRRVTVACPAGGDLLPAARSRGAEALALGFDRMRATVNPWHWLAYLWTWTLCARALADYCRDQRVDLLHAHHPTGVLYCWLAARRHRLPILLHVHEMLPARPLYRLALRVAARRVDRFVCVSSAARALLLAVGIDERRMVTVNNGVDWPFLDDGAPTPEVDRRQGLHVGVFGVLEPRKGQDVFLEAIEPLLARHPSLHCWIVGGPMLADRADFQGRLRARASRGALAGRVTFTGHRHDVGAWMRAMDVVVLPSIAHESMGMVLVEAMTVGRPTVCSRIGVTDQIVQHGQTGFLAPAGDPSGLRTALDSALRADRAEMGRRAAADMRARYAPADFCRRILDLYQTLWRPA